MKSPLEKFYFKKEEMKRYWDKIVARYETQSFSVSYPTCYRIYFLITSSGGKIMFQSTA